MIITEVDRVKGLDSVTETDTVDPIDTNSLFFLDGGKKFVDLAKSLGVTDKEDVSAKGMEGEFHLNLGEDVKIDAVRDTGFKNTLIEQNRGIFITFTDSPTGEKVTMDLLGSALTVTKSKNGFNLTFADQAAEINGGEIYKGVSIEVLKGDKLMTNASRFALNTRNGEFVPPVIAQTAAKAPGKLERFSFYPQKATANVKK